MKWIVYSESLDGRDNHMVLPICVPCIEDRHEDHGWDHRDGEINRRDCKYVEDINGRKVQCNCNPDWSELYSAIEDKSYVGVFDNEAEAEEVKLGLESVGGIE